MVENLMDHGWITRWKEVVCLPGQTAEDTKVIMSMIKRKVKAHSTGQMVENTREVGKMENNTELEHTPLQVEKLSKENGKKAKDFIGFKTNESLMKTIFNRFSL